MGPTAYKTRSVSKEMVLTSFKYKFQHQLFKTQIQLLLGVWETHPA